MDRQIPLSEGASALREEIDETRDDGTHELLPDVAYKRLAIVNVAYLGLGQEWVLVDAGLMRTAGLIRRAAEERFGVPPKAIVLTHGHFDHVGALLDLAEEWDVPIFAHPLEFPYLAGEASYPPADPSVGGGMVSVLSRFFPRSPIDVSRWLQPLPEDGSVPFLSDWSWLHVPGHTPGQVALWRPVDHTLLSADAFITTRQESAYSSMSQEPEMHGPPAYFTQDWVASGESVRRLAELSPELVLTGHGQPMKGPHMREALNLLAANFERVAVPDEGKYVASPACPEDGSAYDAA